MVSLLFLQKRQFGFVSSVLDRFAFRELVAISSSWIAQRSPSTWGENDDFFIHAFVSSLFIWLTDCLLRNKYPCCGLLFQAVRWLSFIFPLIILDSSFGPFVSLVVMSNEVAICSATLINSFFLFVFNDKIHIRVDNCYFFKMMVDWYHSRYEYSTRLFIPRTPLLRGAYSLSCRHWCGNSGWCEYFSGFNVHLF